MTGALLNTGTVLVGGVAGLALQSRVPARVHGWIMKALGVVTICLGVKMVAATRQPLVLVTALALGAAAGTLMRIQRRLENTAYRWQERFVGSGTDSPIAEGFVTTSLLFCVGPMTIIGSIQDGLTGDYHLIALKATMDGVTALMFAAALGWGVLLSAGTVLVVQGGLTLGAQALSALLTGPMITEGTATGGALVLCIGVTLLGLKQLPVADYLPAVFLAPVLARVF